MRISRFHYQDRLQAGFYSDSNVIPLAAAAEVYQQSTGQKIELPGEDDDLLKLLPPEGPFYSNALELFRWISDSPETAVEAIRLPLEMVQLQLPIPRPNKLFLLAGNYAKHIEEGGGIAAERAETFPYVFMKPPTTTLTAPGEPVPIPQVSPKTIDWELELAVVIGRRGKTIAEADALDYVAGFTVINDISDRVFQPNPGRKQRDGDKFFDWLHGKWHDSFCPCGPCIASAESIEDPQNLPLKLAVNGKIMQDSTTARQIFPVAAVIEFISSFITLEPGDIISTGTPAGVGHSSGTYLQDGDRVEATIGSIGTLITPMVVQEE